MGVFGHAGGFTTENAGHGDRLLFIGNHQGVAVQADGVAVEQRQFFALLGHAYANGTVKGRQIEGMHRLAPLQQHQVGDIYHRIYAANAAATQFFLHPQRSGGLDVDILDHSTQVARTGRRGFQFDTDFVIDGGGDRGDLGPVHILLIQYAHFPSQTGHAQAVGAVGGQVHFDGDIVEGQIVTYRGAYGGIGRQFDDAAGVQLDAQLAVRAQHAVRRLTAQLGFLDLEITGQHGADHGHRYFQALATVGRATDDVEQLIAADIDFGHPQLVRIRVLATFNHFTHYNLAEVAGDRLDAIHFQPGHGNLLGKSLGVKAAVDPFIQP